MPPWGKMGHTVHSTNVMLTRFRSKTKNARRYDDQIYTLCFISMQFYYLKFLIKSGNIRLNLGIQVMLRG